MKIPFDIKYRPQIESGEYKVETRDGRSVRIICWDRVAKENTDADLNICVGEAVYYYHQSGKKWVTDESFDLFIITPEPELSEFENAIKDLVLAIDEGELQELGVFEEKNLGAWAVKKAAELFELAKKELCESGEVTDWYAKGKAEALKDLPRWSTNSDPNFKPGKYFCVGNALISPQGWSILFKELEKLPGFKEDEK